MYVIFGGIDVFDEQPMFWSNDDGWGSLSGATQYLENEKNSTPYLPIYSIKWNSVWVKLP